MSAKFFEQRILHDLSASNAEGPDLRFVLMAAFLIISWSVPPNLSGWISVEHLSVNIVVGIFRFWMYFFQIV